MEIIENVKKSIYRHSDFKKEWLVNVDSDAIKWTALLGEHLQSPFIYENEIINGQKKKKQRNRNGRTEDEKVPELKTNQLRKFFGALREFESKLKKPDNNFSKEEKVMMFPKTDLLMIVPKLAYAVGRESNKSAKVGDFFKVITTQIELVDDYDTFMNMMKLIESTVAFHKYFGGE